MSTQAPHARGGVLQVHQLPPGIRVLEKLGCGRISNVARNKTCYQIFIFCLTFAIYAIYTLARRPFSVIKIVLCPSCTNNSNTEPSNESSEELLEGWPPFNVTNGKTLLGSVDYSLIFAYAIGLYLSGYVADRVNRRYFLTLGMFGSGLATMFLGLGYFIPVYHLAYFIMFQIVSGFMQSTGWPGLLGVTGKWFGKKNRGKILSFWGSCSFIGSMLGYFVPSFFIYSENVEDSPWGWSFLLPAFIIWTMAVLTFLFLVTDPAHLGFLPTSEDTDLDQRTPAKDATKDATDVDSSKDSDVSDDISEESQVKTQKPGKSKGVGFIRALLIPGVVEYSLAFFCVKFVAYSFNFWLPFYGTVAHPDLSGRDAAWITTLFDVGGIIGGVLIGAISDKISSRSLVIVPMLVMSVPVLLFLSLFGNISLVFYCFCVLLVGVLINGPHIVIAGAVANDLGTHSSLRDDQHAMSIVSGIIDGTGSMGAAAGPLVVGLVSDKAGWESVFYIFVAVVVMSALWLLRLIITDCRSLIAKCRSKHSQCEDDKNVDSADADQSNKLEGVNRTFDQKLSESDNEFAVDNSVSCDTIMSTPL